MSKSKSIGIPNFEVDPVLPGIVEQPTKDTQNFLDSSGKLEKSTCGCNRGRGSCQNCHNSKPDKRLPSQSGKYK